MNSSSLISFQVLYDKYQYHLGEVSFSVFGLISKWQKYTNYLIQNPKTPKNIIYIVHTSKGPRNVNFMVLTVKEPKFAIPIKPQPIWRHPIQAFPCMETLFFIQTLPVSVDMFTFEVPLPKLRKWAPLNRHMCVS